MSYILAVKGTFQNHEHRLSAMVYILQVMLENSVHFVSHLHSDQFILKNSMYQQY